MRKIRLLTVYLLIFALGGIASAVPLPHTFHTSLTRMDYNAKTKTLEISMQAFVHDLVPTLEKKTGKRIDLEKTPDIDKAVLEYLGDKFIIKNKAGETQKLIWVGREFDVDSVWLYLQIPLPEGLDGATLQNTIFFEEFPEQTNLVICKNGDVKSDLMFKAGDRFKSFAEK